MALIKNLTQYRRYIIRNGWNGLRYRYAGTGAGFFWAFVHPLILILLYLGIFSWIFPLRAQNPSYIWMLISGLLAWQAFADSLLRGSESLAENSRFIKRLACPQEIYVAHVILSHTLLMFLYFLLLVVFMLIRGRALEGPALVVPVILLALQFLAFGFSLVLAPMRVVFPDIEPFLRAVIPLWMWTLPVVYPETLLPGRLRALMYWNPPYLFLRSLRQALVERQMPGWMDWAGIAGWLLAALLAGWLVQRALQDEVKEAV